MFKGRQLKILFVNYPLWRNCIKQLIFINLFICSNINNFISGLTFTIKLAAAIPSLHPLAFPLPPPKKKLRAFF